MMQEVFVGVDIAKDWLDIFHPGSGLRRIDNTAAAARRFAKASAKDGVWVILEASGGYDRLLRDALEATQARFSRVNPGLPAMCIQIVSPDRIERLPRHAGWT